MHRERVLMCPDALLPEGSEPTALRALVGEALRRVIPRVPRNEIIDHALRLDGSHEVPTNDGAFCAFVSGPLYAAVSDAAGETAAGFAMGELDWIISHWHAHRDSGTWADAEPPVIPHLTVVAVDDEPRVIRGLARALRRTSWRVYTATSAEAGLKLCLDHRPDVVLTDINMPVMSGKQFASLISLFIGPIAPAVIALTGDRSSGHDDGLFSVVLRKPVHHRYLVQAVNRTVANKRRRDSG